MAVCAERNSGLSCILPPRSVHRSVTNLLEPLAEALPLRKPATLVRFCLSLTWVILQAQIIYTSKRRAVVGLPRWGSPRSGRRGDTGGGLQEVSPPLAGAARNHCASAASSILIVPRCGLTTSPGLVFSYSKRVPNSIGTGPYPLPFTQRSMLEGPPPRGPRYRYSFPLRTAHAEVGPPKIPKKCVQDSSTERFGGVSWVFSGLMSRRNPGITNGNPQQEVCHAALESRLWILYS